MNNQREFIGFLLDHGAGINGGNKFDLRPLQYALSHCVTEVAAVLLEHGASVHLRSIYGTSPLDRARRFKKWDVVKLR